MKCTKIIGSFTAIFIIMEVVQANPDDHINGWVYPIGSDEDGGYADWHDYDYHVGKDYETDEGDPIYAISSGEIVGYNEFLGGYGGNCGQEGAAILIRHKTAKGKTFYAVYGHNYISTDLRPGDFVLPGQVVGHSHIHHGMVRNSAPPVCPGTDAYRTDHLHFGIRPDEIDPIKKFRGVGSYNNNHGWVNPTVFLGANRPGAVFCSENQSCAVSGVVNTDGSMVGWYPSGNCSDAEVWFELIYQSTTNKHIPRKSLTLGEACLCR